MLMAIINIKLSTRVTFLHFLLALPMLQTRVLIGNFYAFERFSIEYPKTTKVITLANHKYRRQYTKRIKFQICQPSVHLYNRVNTLSCGVLDEQGYTRVF